MTLATSTLASISSICPSSMAAFRLRRNRAFLLEIPRDTGVARLLLRGEEPSRARVATSLVTWGQERFYSSSPSPL